MEAALKQDVVQLTSGGRITPGGYAARASWPSGFTLYESQGRADGVFVVVRGCVVLRAKVRSGRGFVPVIAVEGETFGGEGLTATARYATDARADVATETLHFNTDSFKRFLREQPQEALALIAQIMEERTGLLQRMYELSTLGVEQRLILSLQRLAQSKICLGGAEELVLSPARYRLLCELVGATRESVSLVLSRLGHDGYVHREGTLIRVGPMASLADRLRPPTSIERVTMIPREAADAP